MHWLCNKITVSSSAAWWLNSAIGHWRRKQGRYDKETLACYYTAWRKSPSTANLVAYLKFRRDLGYIPSLHLLEPLFDAWSMSDTAAQRSMINWLTESRRGNLLEMLPSGDLLNHSSSSPPAAAILASRGVPISDNTQALVMLQNQQGIWRKEYSDFLKSNRGSICVVGNAASVEHRGLGHIVDTNEVVLRFNHFASVTVGENSHEKLSKQKYDVGSRLDVWVCAPNLHPPFPTVLESVNWIMLSGPDIRYQLATWNHFVTLLHKQKKVLTVPLSVWKRLVRDLNAPPSAGILCLAWLIEILESPVGIKAFGFQRQTIPSMRYHYALHRHKPSQRHNWEREQELLRHWESRGLEFLD